MPFTSAASLHFDLVSNLYKIIFNFNVALLISINQSNNRSNTLFTIFAKRQTERFSFSIL